MAVMTEAVYDFKAILLDKNRVSLKWKVNPYIVIPGDIFEIQRSSSPSEYSVVKANIGVNFYIDEDVNVYSMWRNCYYKIVVKRLSASTSSYVPIFETTVVLYQDTSPLAREIARRRRLVNKQYCKNLGHFFIRKTFGTRCPVCYDKDYKAATMDDCPNCHGTSFEGGYFIPIPIFYSRGTSPKSNTDTAEDDLETENRNFSFDCYPLASPGDLLIDRTHAIWQVDNVTNTVIDGMDVFQNIYCHREAYDDGKDSLITKIPT